MNIETQTASLYSHPAVVRTPALAGVRVMDLSLNQLFPRHTVMPGDSTRPAWAEVARADADGGMEISEAPNGEEYVTLYPAP